MTPLNFTQSLSEIGFATREVFKMDEKDFKKMNEIIDLYVDSDHPINEIISAMKDNLWYEFMDEIKENLSTSHNTDRLYKI